MATSKRKAVFTIVVGSATSEALQPGNECKSKNMIVMRTASQKRKKYGWDSILALKKSTNHS